MKTSLPIIREELFLFVHEFANKNGYEVVRNEDKANCRLTKTTNSYKIISRMGIHHNKKHQRLEFNGFSTAITQNKFSDILKNLILKKKGILELMKSHPVPNPSLEFGLCTILSWFGANSNPILSYDNRRILITNNSEIDLLKKYLIEYERLVMQCVNETSSLSNIYEKISSLPIEELIDKLYCDYHWSLPNPLIFLVGFKSDRLDEYITFLVNNNRMSNEISGFIELLKDKETINYLNDSFKDEY